MLVYIMAANTGGASRFPSIFFFFCKDGSLICVFLFIYLQESGRTCSARRVEWGRYLSSVDEGTEETGEENFEMLQIPRG